MPSFTPPSCTSRSEVALICQEAEGGQIYNDSREQHCVTTVNIYTALTKDVAKVCGGSKPCRNYNRPRIINHLKNAQVQWKALSPRRRQTGTLLRKRPAVRSYKTEKLLFRIPAACLIICFAASRSSSNFTNSFLTHHFSHSPSAKFSFGDLYRHKYFRIEKKKKNIWQGNYHPETLALSYPGHFNWVSCY